MIFYGVFYKDKDGYDILVQENSQMLVFANKPAASAALTKVVTEANNLLNPRVEYRKVGGFLSKKMEPIPVPKLEDWVRSELIQKKNTCFLKTVNI